MVKTEERLCSVQSIRNDCKTFYGNITGSAVPLLRIMTGMRVKIQSRLRQ
nr:MAG TPA: hypothetical protein [Caudoviricetes sp.]